MMDKGRLVLAITLGCLSVVSFAGCASPSTVAPPETMSTSEPLLLLTSWSEHEWSEKTAEELRESIAKGKIKAHVNQVHPKHDARYWNADWHPDELYQKIETINRKYYETHTYIEGEFDCKEMTTGVWNRLLTEGVTSVIVIGNLDLEKENFAGCNHAWLLVTYAGLRSFAVETTSGEIHIIYYDMDNTEEEFKQYLEGYYFASPSEIKDIAGDRW